MLSLFDDYPIHQTPDPIATPATSDRNVYERYWFNGYTRAGDLYLGHRVRPLPAPRHPGLRHQRRARGACSTRSTRRARTSAEPSVTEVGPFRIEIVEPMRSCRVVLDANETEFACDLLFEGRTANVEEPRHTFGARPAQRIMDTTRFAQLGHWSGWIEIGGQKLELDRAETLGHQGPVVGHPAAGRWRPRGAPRHRTWAVACSSSGRRSTATTWARTTSCSRTGTAGRCTRWARSCPPTTRPADLPGVEDPSTRYMRSLEHQLTFAEDSRMIRGGHAGDELDSTAVTRHEITLEPIFTFRMKGIGYMHPEWGHGAWKGELAMTSEQWSLDDVDETDLFEPARPTPGAGADGRP